MVAIEAAVWEAWKARDEILDELTPKDLAFVDIFGNVTSGKKETIQFWTEHQCDVRTARVADGIGTALSATVGILTFTGILEGTCADRVQRPTRASPTDASRSRMMVIMPSCTSQALMRSACCASVIFGWDNGGAGNDSTNQQALPDEWRSCRLGAAWDQQSAARRSTSSAV